MDTRRMECARNDLHCIFMRPIAPYIGNVAASVHQHGVPCEQCPIVKRRSMATINIGHEFGGPGLCRACAALVCGKAQMPRERRLDAGAVKDLALRSEEHTSELQSLMRISYAVFCLKKKNNT